MRTSVAFIIVSLLVGAAAEASNITVDVQFRKSAGTTYTGTGAAPDTGTTWNQFIGSAPGPTTLTNLLNSQGGTAAVNLSVSNYQNEDWQASLTSNAMLNGYLFTDNAAPATSTTGTFTISGLTDGYTYNLYVYSLLGSTGQGSGEFTIGAQTLTDSGGTTGATASTIPISDLGKSYVEFVGLSPTGGVITGTWTDNGTFFAGIMNGMQLVNLVPEPAAYLQFGLAAVALVLVARRRKAAVTRAFCAFFAMFLFVATSADASNIVTNVQFSASNGTGNVGSNTPAAVLYTGIGAAPDTGTTWNQVVSPVNSGATLTLNNLETSQAVTQTGLDVNVSGYQNTGFNANPSATSPINNLVSAYIFTNGSDAGGKNLGTFTISGLAAGSYDLYLYSSFRGNPFSSKFTVNGVSQTTSNATSGATTSTIPTTDLGKSYVVYTGLSPLGGVITGTWTEAADHTQPGIFNGFQLVQVVPEPAAYVQFSLAVAGLFFAARRCRKSA